ncbi:2,3-bisphosphoglycerate-independent phosphoglycerate mutase [Pseudomonadota bacterium]
MNQKCVIVILDGLGDRPVERLGGRTPLEAAATPVMNRLAGSGRYGLVDPIAPGVVPNTHSGCGVLFGVSPSDVSLLKRGPVEASGAGRRLQPGEIAFRCNFATLEAGPDGLHIVDRRSGRIEEDTAELAAGLRHLDLGDGISAELLSTDQHRCVLVLSGPGLNPMVSDTDPGDRGMPSAVRRCQPLEEAAQKTAEKINLFIDQAHQLLSVHPVNQQRVSEGKLPANGIISRGAGEGFRLTNLVQERGLKAMVVAGCNTVIGLARTIGLDTRSDERFTAAANTDLQAKMSTALELLSSHDLVYVHVKAPDLFAHDRQPENKSHFLECVDESMEVLEQAGVMVVVAADHSTDSNSGSHTDDPIPALFYQPAQAAGGSGIAVNFGESLCATGTMRRQSSNSLLSMVLNAMRTP